MQAINISEKNKVLVWSPAHTASRLAWKIFDNFDFSSYDPRNKMKLIKNAFEHNHFIGLPTNHKEYKIILTCRNPYTSTTAGIDGQNSQEDFFRTAETMFQNQYHFNFISHLRFRKPDYFIRVENLLEDYLKIPFIRHSEFYKSGQLENLINNNAFKGVYTNRPKIDKRAADLIYYNNVYYFELLGYDKNSWKE